MSDLAELLKIAEAATPGPWTVEKYGQESLVVHYDRDNRVCFMATPGKLSDWKTIRLNAAHIAAFNPTVAEALVRVAMAAEKLMQHIERIKYRDSAQMRLDERNPFVEALQAALTLALKGSNHG